jgi:uroporphyrinogen decarboxylase
MNNLTRKERVLAAVRHEATDEVPWNIELTSDLKARAADAAGVDPAEFDEWAGNHCAKISYNIGGGEIRPGYFEDEFGVVWDRTGIDKDIGVVEEYLIRETALDSYDFPDPPVEAVKEATEKGLSAAGDRCVFGKIGMTYFERAWSLCGMENLMMQFLLDPDFVEALFGRILDYNMEIIRAACEYDIDGFYFGDDYGQQTGMLMSPEVWRRFIKPGLAEMIGYVKERGKITALHSCGDITPILPDLIEIGLDIYQTVQPEIYDLPKLAMEFGDDLTFWGGISTQKDLPFEDPEGVRRIARETIAVLSDNGGYILSPTHRIPGDVPVENVLALIEAAKNQG